MMKTFIECPLQKVTIIRNVACFLLWLITCMLLRTSVIKQHNLLLHRYFISKSELLKHELTAYKDQPLPMHFKEILKPYLGLYHFTSVNHDYKIPLLKIQKMAKEIQYGIKASVFYVKHYGCLHVNYELV